MRRGGSSVRSSTNLRSSATTGFSARREWAATRPDGDLVHDFSRFDWVPVIVSIADRLGVSDVIKAVDVARSFGRKSPTALSALGRRAATLGERALAFQLGEDALRLGDPVG